MKTLFKKSNLKTPAPKERGSPSPTFGTKVGLGEQNSNPNLKSQNKFKLKAQSAKCPERKPAAFYGASKAKA